MEGPISQFLADDHRRLDALLGAATTTPHRIDLEPYGLFRAGLLRHIAIEEKILFPALREAVPDSAPITAKLRVDHGALTALLVPTPTPAIVAQIRFILVPHNQREEGPEGVYARCDRALGPAGAQRLVERARALPDVPLNPYNDGPLVEKHVASSVELARRQWAEGDEPDA